MLFHISTALTLLALVAGMYLLAKTKAEGQGKFFSFVSWLIIVMCGLMLVFSIVHACMNMCCRGGGRMIERECIIEGRGSMMGGHHGMRSGDCCDRMGCEGEGDMDCCRGMKGEEGMMKEKEIEEKVDTVKH